LGIDIDGVDGAYLVKRWANEMIPPFAEASIIVQEWYELCAMDSEKRYGK
jgi:hypothetical protein